MTDITALTKLRIELSNPAIGSKDHLRKISLSLIDELEDSRAQVGRHEDFIREQDQLIRDLKRNLHALMQRTVTVKPAEAYGYLRENNGQIQISIGAVRPSDRSGGYATPWFAIYTAAGIQVSEGDTP